MPLDELPLAAMQATEPRITKAVFGVLSVEKSVTSRAVYGGTAPKNVRFRPNAGLNVWKKRKPDRNALPTKSRRYRVIC